MYKTFTILVLLSYSCTLAQQIKVLDSLNFNGKLRVHGAVFDSNFELQQNSPRVGVFLKRSLAKRFDVVGVLEYGMNLVDGTELNNDANTVIEFASQPFETKETFTSRIAYLGVTHPKYGSLSIGKQWGVYYDIASYTDNFTVFGGEAHGVYAGNTDGGWKGTGRADNAVVYRNTFKKLSLGLQSQFIAGRVNYAAAVSYDVSNSFRMGFAFNSARIAADFNDFISYEREQNTNYVFAAQYQKSNFQIGASFSINQDEFSVIDTPDDSLQIVAYPTHGFELFSSIFLTDHWELQAGFNRIHDIEDTSFFRGNYTLMHYVMGINYHLNNNTLIYSSARIGDSNLVNNTRDYNVYLIGFAFNFTYAKHNIDL